MRTTLTWLVLTVVFGSFGFGCVLECTTADGKPGFEEQPGVCEAY